MITPDSSQWLTQSGMSSRFKNPANSDDELKTLSSRAYQSPIKLRQLARNASSLEMRIKLRQLQREIEKRKGRLTESPQDQERDENNASKSHHPADTTTLRKARCAFKAETSSFGHPCSMRGHNHR